MKNILLTGSGGFIGSHLKNFLKNKYNLFTPRSYELNLLDKGSLEKFFNENKIEFIIHCASCGARIKSDATLYDTANPNIQMFKNLADFVNDSCPMITIGSGAEYDKSKPVVKVKEEEFGKFVPKDPYGYSKYIISKEIEKRENILNLRVFGIYGFGEDSSRVTGCIINANIKKEPIILNQNVKFSFIWIDDFCKIVEYFLNHKTKEKFLNITPSESIEIVDLAKIVNDFSDYKSEIIVKKSGLNNEYTGDNSKLLNEIGKFDFTSYKDGLKIYYEKQQKNNKLTKS